MPNFDDDPVLDCYITVELLDGSTKEVPFPCGMVFDTVVATEEEGTVTQLPYKYQILRERASLKPCCHWRDLTINPEDINPEDLQVAYDTPNTFSYKVIEDLEGLTDLEVTDLGDTASSDIVVGGWLHEDEPSFLIQPRTFETVPTDTTITTKCTQPGAEQYHQGQDGAPPCNGAKTNCPFYTGPSFKYLKDVDVRPGDPITGQQVQEMRSLIRDWSLIPDAEEVWNQTFEDPYIWSRDFEDDPMYIAQEAPDVIQDNPDSVKLVKVSWNVVEKDAVLVIEPSTPSEGTPVENTEGQTTSPSYYSIIGDLGNAIKAPIEVTFPPPLSANGDNIYDTGFVYNSFSNYRNTMYLAGTTYAVTNVYIVNTSIIDSFPELDAGKEDYNEQVSESILELVDTLGTTGSFTGFRVVTSSQDRFWDIPEGIDLQPNEVNEVLILVRTGNQWTHLKIFIDYRFHHAELIQNGFTAVLQTPQSQSLVTGLANLAPKENILFHSNILSGSLTISKAYHYYVFDRSFSRMLYAQDEEALPDRRYWSVSKRSELVTGDGEIGGSLKWSRLDNCNRYLIEIVEPQLSSAKPGGIDRTWEPREILFNVVPESEESEESPEGTEIVMEVVEGIGEVSRSLDGTLLPVRFLMVEPKGGGSISFPSKTSTMSVNLDIFEASNTLNEDDFDEIYSEFPDPLTSNAGGVRITGVTDKTMLAEASVHDVDISSSVLNLGKSSKYDMSYIVEFSTPDGEVIGRKWIYAVGEICHTWARDVDIQYKWSSIETEQTLTPDYSRATRQLNKPEKFFDPGDGSQKSSGVATYTPACGDHEKTWLFTPYSTCTPAQIAINDGGIILNQRIDLEKDYYERYRGPERQRPYSIQHNVAGIFSSCVFEWTFGTKNRQESTWAGLARLRGPVSEYLDLYLWSAYVSKDWAFPPSGNKGREHIRIFRTMHYREYLYPAVGGLKVGAGWMPAVPFLGSSSIFDDTQPRTLFDYSTESSSLTEKDYNSYEGHLEILSEETGTSTTNSEVVSFEREDFDTTFQVRRPGASNLAYGTRWPPEGLYFNPKEYTTLWGYIEPSSDVGREHSNTVKGSYLNGVVFQKPTVNGSRLTDRFSRPVEIGPDEGLQTVTLEMPELDEDGNEVEYGKIFIDENAPLYYDKADGEIQETDKEGNPAIYTLTTVTGIIAALGELGIEPEIVPVYEPVSAKAAESIPESLEDLEDITFYSNVVSDLSIVYIYSTNGPTGNNLDDEEVIWKGFFKGVEVLAISPRLFPYSELPVEDQSVSQMPTANFGNYPSIDLVTREAKSGRELDAISELFFGEVEAYVYDWKPYSLDDLSLPDPSKGEGQIGPSSITVTFASVVEVSSIEFSYKLYGREQGTVFSQPIAGPFTDPEFSVALVGDTTLELVSKPRISIKEVDNEDVIRNFSFDSTNMEAFKTKQIEVFIGSRDDATGFSLSSFSVKVRRYEGAVEEFSCLDQKYILSKGYGTSDPDSITGNSQYLPSQRKFLSGVGALRDQPDSLETVGIAELWQPGMASLDYEVGTFGKIRRHWASDWMTYDTLKYYEEDTSPAVFVDSTVELSEKRQITLLENMEDKLKSVEKLLKMPLQYFVNASDQYLLSKYNLSTGLEGTSINMNVEASDKWVNADSIVAPVPLPAGWQPDGFHACHGTTEQVVKSCVVNLGVIGFGSGSRTAHYVYKNQSHDTCTSDGKGGRSAYSLFQFGRLTDKIAGAMGTSAAGLLGQVDAGVFDSYSDLLSNQVRSESLVEAVSDAARNREEKARQNLARYRP